MKLSERNPTVHLLLDLLDQIERELRAHCLWKEKRSHDQDEWLPLEEWIQFVMIPRDRALLRKWEIPLDYSVGSMALVDFREVPDTIHLTELLTAYETKVQKNQQK